MMLLILLFFITPALCFEFNVNRRCNIRNDVATCGHLRQGIYELRTSGGTRRLQIHYLDPAAIVMMERRNLPSLSLLLIEDGYEQQCSQMNSDFELDIFVESHHCFHEVTTPSSVAKTSKSTSTGHISLNFSITSTDSAAGSIRVTVERMDNISVTTTIPTNGTTEQSDWHLVSWANFSTAIQALFIIIITMLRLYVLITRHQLMNQQIPPADPRPNAVIRPQPQPVVQNANPPAPGRPVVPRRRNPDPAIPLRRSNRQRRPVQRYQY